MYSKNKEYRPFVILSACNGLDSDAYATRELFKELKAKKYNFKVVKGCYEGKTEESFYVELINLTDHISFIDIASRYSQESVLLVDSNRDASLLFIDGSIQDLGKFKQCGECFAKQHTAWTYDIQHDAYYVTTKTNIN